MEKFTTCVDSIGAKHSAFCEGLADTLKIAGWRLVFNAPFTLWFGIICTVLYAIKSTETVPSFDHIFQSPTRWQLTSNPLMSFLKLFTHILGHASWPHLTGNLSQVLLITPFLEEKYKIRWLIIISMINGMTAAIINCISTRDTVVLGASGVVFQMMLLAVFSGRYLKPGDIPMTFLLAIGVYILPEVHLFSDPKDGVSHMAHLVGGAVGALAALLARNHIWISHELERAPARAVVGPAPRAQMSTVQQARTRFV